MPSAIVEAKTSAVEQRPLMSDLIWNLALEPTQGILDGLTLLQSNFCQSVHPQPSPDWTIYSLSFALPRRPSGEIGTLILSSRHHFLSDRRYRLDRHLRLPLRLLPRQAVLERGHRR
jgi:hypothetical protein